MVVTWNGTTKNFLTYYCGVEGRMTSFKGRFEIKLFNASNTINMIHVSIFLSNALSKEYMNKKIQRVFFFVNEYQRVELNLKEYKFYACPLNLL